MTYRLPRVPAVPGTKTLTGLGAIGYFVDGVAMFDSRDGFSWNGSTEACGAGSAAWERDAWVNQGVTFDPAYAHQEQSGTYHYHANPVALRYLLGDHVDFNATTKAYAESTGVVTKHSPVLGFCRDGYPIYGPYGYSSAMEAGSGVRRMVSGFALRDGTNGTDNLNVTGRTAAAAWVTRLGITSSAGPTVGTTYPLGRNMADNAYLGDLGRTQGVDFDLDEYNGRTCVTPEYLAGTYAYFVASNADGTPRFPYNIGRAFYGSPTGSASSITETVTTAKYGPDMAETWNASPAISGGNVTLEWNSVEGGTYQIQASGDLSSWTSLTPAVTAAANAIVTSATETGGASTSWRFYKISRTALATYDGGTTGGGGTTATAPGGSATRGTTVTVTITITAPPNLPPWTSATANPQPSSVVLAGTITGTGITRPSQSTVQATFVIPAGAPTGAQSIVVTFPGMAGNGPVYTVTPFTLN